MDVYTVHELRLHERRFPSPLPANQIGYVPVKRAPYRNRIQDAAVQGGPSFHFIFSGTGEYRTPTGIWPIAAPCVFAVTPDTIPCEFGPQTEWEEFWILYGSDSVPLLRKSHLLRSGRTVWPIGADGRARDLVERILELGRELPTPGTADLIDRYCELLVVLSHLGHSRHKATVDGRVVEDIRRDLVTKRGRPADAMHLAQMKAGMSPTRFRALWRQQVGLPIGAYRRKVQIQAACELLQTTNLRIKEVAERSGFRDPLYFSRVFSRATGTSPRQYRKQGLFR